MLSSRKRVLSVICAGLPVAMSAQTVAVGAAVDGRSGAPLACVEVALEDSASSVVASGRTDERGLFQLPAPVTGPLKVRFRIQDYLPVYAPAQATGPGAPAVPAYRVLFERYVRPVGPVRPPEDTASDAEPWPVLRPGRGPRYPEALKMGSIEGAAVVQFVVDSAGAVVPTSIRPMGATHREFADAVVRFLRRDAQFRPARRAGRPVCAMLQAPFEFAITR